VNDEGFKFVNGSYLVQQYYNHDANFFKVYVIGSEVMVFQRPSLPNLSSDAVSPHNEMKSVAFDSRFAYPVLSDFVVTPSCRAGQVHDYDSQEALSVVLSLDDRDPNEGERNRDNISICESTSPVGSPVSSRKRKPSALDMLTSSPPSRYLQQESNVPPLSLENDGFTVCATPPASVFSLSELPAIGISIGNFHDFVFGAV
jgi:hypothetical protein